MPPRKSHTGLIVGVVAAALVVLVVLGGGVVALTNGDGGPLVAGGPTHTPSGGVGFTSCVYTADQGQPPAKYVGLPDRADRVSTRGTARVTLKTNHGDIPLVLDRAKAPCAVQSFVYLTTKGYFDGTSCTKLMIDLHIKMLQCGDPTGTERGEPGYGFKDELPTGLKPADHGNVVYPKGTVAMIHAVGSDANGSQFILFYGDTWLPPGCTVFGTYRDPGQATLDTIVAGGVTRSYVPNTMLTIPSPKNPVTIQQAATD